MNQFSEFADAVTQPRRAPTETPQVFNRIAVLGGGDDARLLAALSLSEGAEVTLFSAYGKELEALRQGSGISIRGAGPVGSYQVDRQSAPSVRTTAELDAAVADAQVIFLTGPVHKQRTYAMVLADHLSDGQVLVLANGRSLSALEAAWSLRIGGCTADITIVEVQGLPYWISSEGSVLNLTDRASVAAATLPSDRGAVIEGLTKFLPNLEAHQNVVSSGFSDGSAAVEFPVLLMQGVALSSSAIKVPMGGKPLPENENFRALIGPEQEAVIGELVAERASVASAFGVRNNAGATQMIETYAGTIKGEGCRPVPSRQQAQELLRDGVIGSLVPLVSAAELCGLEVPVTRAMITLAGAVLGADVASAGRRFSTIGIDASDIDVARTRMDAIARGRR